MKICFDGNSTRAKNRYAQCSLQKKTVSRLLSPGYSHRCCVTIPDVLVDLKQNRNAWTITIRRFLLSLQSLSYLNPPRRDKQRTLLYSPLHKSKSRSPTHTPAIQLGKATISLLPLPLCDRERTVQTSV
jgi:hypothetical protein